MPFCQGGPACSEAGPTGMGSGAPAGMPGCCHRGCRALKWPGVALPDCPANAVPSSCTSSSSCWLVGRCDTLEPRASMGWRPAPTGAPSASVPASVPAPEGCGCSAVGGSGSCRWAAEGAACASGEGCRRGSGPLTLISTPGTASSCSTMPGSLAAPASCAGRAASAVRCCCACCAPRLPAGGGLNLIVMPPDSSVSAPLACWMGHAI